MAPKRKSAEPKSARARPRAPTVDPAALAAAKEDEAKAKPAPGAAPWRRPEKRVLVLQGGGALGSYQAGVYEALAKASLEPEWVAGISIGAINAAIIAGNPPERRGARLLEFWERISSTLTGKPLVPGDQGEALYNEISASLVATWGVPGFFIPRIPPAFLYPPGATEALSYYDTSPLRASLETFVDFDLINSRKVRLSVGSVNIRSGNFVYFDNAEQTIGPEHIMASGALPPGFPPVEIDGEHYWDGGLVSNAPLQYVIDTGFDQDLLIFQVDLFSARGQMPRTLLDAAERAKDIRYSSRTRLSTDAFRRMQTLKMALHRLLQRLPDPLGDDPDVGLLKSVANDAAATIVHLIYRGKNYDSASKDYEFSRRSMLEHWQAGSNDVRRTLRHRDWCNRDRPHSGVTVFDLTPDAKD
jgi:NTE family protein